MHSQHGHAHTFHVLNDSPEIVSKFAGKTFNGGEQFGTYHYQANAETTKKTGTDHPIADAELTATIPTVFGDNPFPLQYALGSGHNAYTLLTLITEENGETTGTSSELVCRSRQFGHHPGTLKVFLQMDSNSSEISAGVTI